MRKIAGRLILSVLMAGIFISCKPTEKNYSAAYNAALAKREARAAENMLPAEGLLSEDGPQRRILDGDTLFVVRERLSLPEGGAAPRGWYLGVGLYKMSTNAGAQATHLGAEGLTGAGAFRAAGDRWYAVADTASSFEAIRIKDRLFREKHPGYPYIGLPGAPVIIETR